MKELTAFSKTAHPRTITILSLALLISGTCEEPVRSAETSPTEGTEYWAFRPSRDEFSANSLLDLRSLNEKIAGDHGFVSRTTDGNDFAFSDGTPVRFWALNDGAFDTDLERHARFIAKRGINMVRFHCNITPTGNDLMAIDKTDRDHLWRGVAAMKKQGIYVTYSPYWAGPARVKPSMGVLDTGGNGNWGLLFFDARLQEAYKGWLRQVLVETNTYTGIPLAADPALAIIELQNEDSLLFWTVQGIKGQARRELRKQFGAFVSRKYGSLERARQAWNDAAPSPDQDSPDDLAQGEAALYLVWQLTQAPGPEGVQRRCSDQMQFLTETMYRFNRTMGEFLRNECHCKQLVNAGNWRTANNVTMLDAERWSYSANEVMAVNRYYTGVHEGKNNGWAIVNGDVFTDESALLRPLEMPLALKQVEGFPMLVTESSWVPPLSYQSEGPFLVAAYQSLSGIDAFYWFATGEEDWRQPGSANGFMPSEGKWVCATPMIMGQWPASALMFRRGYVKQGQPVVQEHRSQDDLWQRRAPVIAEEPGYDPNRDQGSKPAQSHSKGNVSPLAYLVGPVEVKYDGDSTRTRVADLNQFVHVEAKQVEANTGEIHYDYGRGICQLDTAKAQGVTGFLKRAGGKFKFRDLEIVSGDDYATVLAVAMDDRPLGESKQVLIQVGTTERPAGWKTKPAEFKGKAAEEVVDFGHAPWMIARSHVTILIRNTKLSTARVLDVNGIPVKGSRLEVQDAAKRLVFPADALYVMLE
ncbi:MAG TPA: hypothetical protein VKY92_15915 [Verrucomicrobiae bacterium]|nr:hypothetical protein [Verrucomicrobiae bacterium]